MEDGRRTHEECVALTSSAYTGVPVGGGQCHTEGGPSAADTCMVYGELTWSGMESLYGALKLQAHDHLYDLGSGIGKFVLYSALRNNCASVTGVEVGLKRHHSAELACTNLEELLSAVEPSERRCAGFSAVLGDIRLPLYRDATAIVLCNIMFDGTLNSAVLREVLRCPRVTQIASIVQLHHSRLKRRKAISCGCTWSTGGVSWTLYSVLPESEGGRPRSQRSDVRCAPTPPMQWVRPKTVASGEKCIVPGGGRPITASGGAAALVATEQLWQRLASTRIGGLRSGAAAAAAARRLDEKQQPTSRHGGGSRGSRLVSRLESARRMAASTQA
jgi:hypothetical protein